MYLRKISQGAPEKYIEKCTEKGRNAFEIRYPKMRLKNTLKNALKKGRNVFEIRYPKMRLKNTLKKRQEHIH